MLLRMKGVAVVVLVGLTSLASSAEEASRKTFVQQASDAIKTLNSRFYNVKTGVYDDAWWNSANAITTMADFADLDLGEANRINVGGYLRNTFIQAQKTDVKTVKAMKNGRVMSTYCLDHSGGGCMSKREFSHYPKHLLLRRGFDDFINEFYDDEGWWALAWIRAYDVSGDQEYLDAAVSLFKDMKTGAGTPCGGGIFWNKDRKYVNAIANELFFSVAASLATRLPKQGEYLTQARAQWTWFENSGMINPRGLVNDGLDGSCKNNGLPTWTYNQGVVMGGLVELWRATGERRFLDRAVAFADATLAALQTEAGILHEVDDCETKAGNCGKDGQQFKGIFVRNLHHLVKALEKPPSKYRDFILRNARSIWEKDRAESKLGPAWSGPYIEATGPSQSSALDALVAAISVS
ncbi:glycosyl hydrolase [Ophiocordyceps camponoti-floridani]|uniref:Glycosyl hydrolase n=1 Tax=Ophiocordyceps camponoti-floridani TaxID=2030778 RepID=A0A8H4QB23_9HYPO|nr:glycosyl hydrolase [Ophiocordyceps camponoti-floridani]